MNFAMSVWLAIFLTVLNVASTSAADDENVNEVKDTIVSKKRKWTKEKELEMMKIWNEYYEGGSLDNNPALRDKWKHLFTSDTNETLCLIMRKANRLLKQGFWIPAEHNGGVPVYLDTTDRERRTEHWRFRKMFPHMFGGRVPRIADQQSTLGHPEAQLIKSGKSKFDPFTEDESERSTKSRKHFAQEAGQTPRAGRRNDNRGKRPISPDSYQNFTGFNTPSILDSSAPDYGWPVNQTGHHYGYPQHHMEIDTSTPQFDPASDYYTHQAFHLPQFEQSSYHELNNPLNYQDPSSYQYLANNPVHRPDYSQLHHAAGSSNSQQETPHSNRESNIPSSSLDPNLKYIHNNPYFPPSHDNKTF